MSPAINRRSIIEYPDWDFLKTPHMSPAINRRSIIEYPDWDFLKTPCGEWFSILGILGI